MFLSAMELLVDNPRSALLPVMFNFHVPLLCDLLEIYCPSWIKHMKFRPDAGGSNISYLTYMTLADRGFVETIDEPLLAQIVGELPWHNHDNTGKIFLERKELLDEHVWLLFRYNTPVAWNDDTAISAFAEGRTKNNGSLQALLLNRVAEGRIDRARLLKSSLDALVAVRSQPRWFIGIIEGLQPTAAELLSLQALLFQGLVAKVLGSMKLLLHLLRQIAIEPAFNYTDYISAMPAGFALTAHTPVCPIAAMENAAQRLYAVQFHPEVMHTEHGSEILHNFVYNVCGCTGTWRMDSFVQKTIEELREKIGGGRALCALSGGVDSSVAAVLLSKAIGKNLTCVFVDHGLLRKNEGDEVEAVFGSAGTYDVNFIRINAQERFYEKLKGVTEPEQKRKIIGAEFIRVFEEAAHEIGAVDFLVQGTIYPDVIESGLGKSAVIKSHHNVGGLPDHVDFKEIVEPLRLLF